jgi:cation transport regulator ChaB
MTDGQAELPFRLQVPPRYAEAFASALAERRRQDRKWGRQCHDLAWWAVILGEEYGEACKAIFAYMAPHGSGGIEAVRDELVQLAAVALAATQDIDQALAGGVAHVLAAHSDPVDHAVLHPAEAKRRVVEWGD